MIKEEYTYSDLTSKVIGCSISVHKALGNGFQEVICQRCLAIEFEETEIQFVREQEMPFFTKLMR
jgi:GxxExxY protein